ncbi:hypothetical protein [Micromonospora sp. NPDC004704]
MLIVGITACGAGDTNGGATAGASGQTATTGVSNQPAMHADRVKDWTRADLRAKAEAVVRVKAISNAEGRVWADDLNPDTAIPATLTKVQVLRTYAGKAPETLLVKQIGTAKASSDDFAPLLELGGEYLMWTHPWEMWPGEPGEQSWALTGNQGVYRLTTPLSGAARWVYAGVSSAPFGRELTTADVDSGAFLR